MPAFSWTSDPAVAEREQGTLQSLLSLTTTLPSSLAFDRGIAIGTAYDENTRTAFACGVFFDGAGYYRVGIDDVASRAPVEFDYVPGLLAYRVGPAVCKLLDRVIDDVDVIMLDGQGIAHQRGLGLAAHIGVLYDKPAVGVTRNILFGSVNDPPSGRFNKQPITHPQSSLVLGYALSLGDECATCYVSPGHRLSVDDATSIVCTVAGNGCFPKPLNRAHARANASAKRYWEQSRASSQVKKQYL